MVGRNTGLDVKPPRQDATIPSAHSTDTSQSEEESSKEQ